MAITVEWGTKVISIPQADLTLVSGSLYELDTQTQFRVPLNALMASEEGIPFDTPLDHNSEYTVAGVTYARKIEVINGYSVTFTPDAQYSVRLAGSNNNLFDVENGILNQNQVSVIGNNSAGLIVVTSGSGLSVAQAAQLKELWQLQGLELGNAMTVTPTQRKVADDAIDQAISGDGDTTTTVTRQ